MNFQLHQAIEILERTPQTLTSLLSGLSEEWLTCNEGEDTWNAKEVVAHLIEGEKQDWVNRIEIILTKGESKTFQPFDRTGHLQREETTIDALLEEFTTLRERNLEKVAELISKETNFETTGRHPAFGSVKLRELVSTWAAHDLGHLNQITRVMAKRYKTDVGPWQAYLSVMNR